MLTNPSLYLHKFPVAWGLSHLNLFSCICVCLKAPFVELVFEQSVLWLLMPCCFSTKASAPHYASKSFQLLKGFKSIQFILLYVYVCLKAPFAQSVLWLLMPWCFSPKASAATILTTNNSLRLNKFPVVLGLSPCNLFYCICVCLRSPFALALCYLQALWWLLCDGLSGHWTLLLILWQTAGMLQCAYFNLLLLFKKVGTQFKLCFEKKS